MITDTSSDFVPLIEPCLGGNEWHYIKDCLDSGWVSSAGKYVERFETALAQAVDRKFAVATSNGTSALHTALLIAGVGQGDEVLVSDLTFVAPANCIKYVGAEPVFIDAEGSHWQMDIGLIEKFLNSCRREKSGIFNPETGRRVGAILPVHILGHPVEIDRLCSLAANFQIPVIEDATESLGALFKNRPAGSFGLVSCFSFNGNKLLTTGGGGMLTTDDPALASKAKYLTTQAKDDPIEYIHSKVGYNYRLTNIQAALGCAQLEKLDQFLRAKRAIAARYRAGLEELHEIEFMAEANNVRSSEWMFTILVTGKASSRDLLRSLASRGIQSRPLWQPMHLSPAHRSAKTIGGSVSEKLYSNALSLPCSVGLKEAVQHRIICDIRKFFEG